jgi:hypothetical protein
MDNLECNQFIIVLFDTSYKVKTSVTAINDLGILVFDKVAHFGASCQDELAHVLDNLLTVFWGDCDEPFGQADFALFAEEEDVVDLCG